MAGMLAQMLGQPPADQKAILEEAKENANDLSGLVRKKKPKAAANGDAVENGGKGKRKLEEEEEEMVDGDSKKTRVE